MRRVRWVLLIGFVLAFASPTVAQPRRRTPTMADIERLEKKIEEQQRLIDKLVKLQQQYLQALTAILGTPSSGGAVVPEKPEKPPVTDTTPKPAAPKPAVVKPAPPKKPDPPAATGMGTIVGKIAGADDAVVYVEDIVQSTKGSASIKQENKQFSPRVLVVQKGTTVSFPNRDAIFHNVFSVSPDHSFDLGSYRQGESKSVTMSRPGVVTVYCNMHPQMIAHILVVPNGNYVRAGKDGFFRLQNVPAGNHKVVAWAPNAKPTSVSATVADGEVVTVELSVKKGRASPHTRKDGLPYGQYDK